MNFTIGYGVAAYVNPWEVQIYKEIFNKMYTPFEIGFN